MAEKGRDYRGTVYTVYVIIKCTLLDDTIYISTNLASVN